MAYRCAITIETSVGRELPSKSLLVRTVSELTFKRITLSNTTRHAFVILAINVYEFTKCDYCVEKLIKSEMRKIIDLRRTRNKLARFSLLSSNDSHRSGVTQHCVNIVFVQCLWCNAHYGDCSIRENVYHISPYKEISFVRIHRPIVNATILV